MFVKNIKSVRYSTDIFQSQYAEEHFTRRAISPSHTNVSQDGQFRSDTIESFVNTITVNGFLDSNHRTSTSEPARAFLQI